MDIPLPPSNPESKKWAREFRRVLRKSRKSAGFDFKARLYNWLFGTALVGLFSFLTSQYVQYLSDRQQVRKVEIEMSNRLRNAGLAIKKARINKEIPAILWSALDLRDTNTQALFPEFAKAPFRGLNFQLSLYGRSEDDRIFTTVASALAKLESVQDAIPELEKQGGDGVVLATFDGILTQTTTNLETQCRPEENGVKALAKNFGRFLQDFL
jgi:hypothetical protein